jgi:ABC-2 type transport system permease protein
MGTLTRIELYKIFTRKRSYISFLAVIIIILIAQAAMLWEGESLYAFLTKNLSDAFYMQGRLVNGYLMTYLVLNFLWVHIPLLVVIVTGDLLSGEAHGGTLRLILSRPVSRSSLVTAKFLAAFIYTIILMVIFALFSLGLGLLLFGEGDLIVIFDAINILPASDLFWRFMAAFAYGTLGMISIASLSLLLSSLSRNSLGPILSTMAIIILFTMISSFEFNIFKPLKPFLITTYLDSWQMLFSFTPDMKNLLTDASVLLLHCIIFYLYTLLYFKRKDILT